MSKALCSAIIFILFGAIMLFQLNGINVLALDEANPITSAIISTINDITTQESTPSAEESSSSADIVEPTPTASSSASPQPISEPISAAITEPTPTPSATPEPSSEPITSSITNPTPTPQPSSDPITGPITNPTPTPEPITGPVAQATPQPSSQSSGGSNESNGQSSSRSPFDAPICSDSRPTSAPKIVSAVSNQPNQVTLVWTKANDPLSYYMVAYGLESNKPLFGNPNIGDKNTIIYTVKALSGGTTYYFKVRGGNGCMPGEFSNEVKVLVVGPKINTSIAEGFEAGVLSQHTESEATPSAEKIEVPFKPITFAQPQRVISEAGNIFTKIINFIKHIFDR